ncbi:MAG: 4Fe-4S dicluster domain-containing protein [Planctomycetes bacterium]|nr:4Fe-4S dicluster domain-containing protein [Planctomycetota bacterium]
MNPIAMTVLLAIGWGAFFYSIRRRWKLMLVGVAEPRFDRPVERARLTVKYALAQMRMGRYPLAGFAHMLIFSGFLVLLLRTLILWGRGYDESFSFWIFSTDTYLGQTYSFFKDFFAVMVILGTLVFVYYRVIKRPTRMTLSTEGLVILGIILAMMVADIVYDGAGLVLRAREASVATPFLVCEPAGSVAASTIDGLPDGALTLLKHVGFWTHSALVLIFLNLLPYSKHFHIITAIPNVYFQRLDPPGMLPNLEDIEGKLEREETLGIKRIDQFSWKSIMDFYTCTECGRCSDFCPATKTGKKLSPKHFTLDLRDFLYKHEEALVSSKAKGNGSEPRPSGSGSSELQAPGADGNPLEHLKDLVDGVIDPEVLWACTTCRACEQECPVFITFVDKIVDMRRYLVQERGEFPKELQTAFRGLESSGNPWSFPTEDRDKWAEGLNIKRLTDHPDAEVLFWIGCAPAFDERAKKVTRATAQLMQKAGIDFAILGNEETCTGDPARRAGNEYLFQTFARQNVETLNGHGVDKKKIITTCPHCFNTLLNEYPDFGGKYEVVHHSTFLADLVKRGKLKPTKRIDKKVVYHDSCYLGRYNEVYDAPRDVLRSIPGLTVLEPKETRDRGMCCGAGGAQMFKEEEPGDERVNMVRTKQLLDTKPDAVSSACPFCMRMLTDGLAGHDREELPQLDIAEILLDAIEA